MVGDLKYLDVCEFFYEPLSKFCVHSNDHLTAITTTTGLLVLKLQPDLEKAVNHVTYIKLFITPSSYMLIRHIEIDVASFLFNLPQDSVFMCILESSIIGDLENTKKSNFFVNKCGISPSRLIGEEPVIATITDVGSLDVYVRVSHITGLTAYEHILNINDLHIEKIKYRWRDVSECSTNDIYNEAVKRLSMHTAKGVCWSHMMDQKISVHGRRQKAFMLRYCCMIVAYGDGSIVFWQMNQIPMDNYKQAAATFMYEYASGLHNITALCWHGSSTCSGLLIVGDVCGKTLVVPVVKMILNYFEIGGEVVLTTCTGVAVDNIDVEMKNDHLIVHVVQQHHLLLFVLDKNAKVCQRDVYDCTNLNITGFQKTLANTVLLSTLTGAIIEIKTSIMGGKLNVLSKDIFINMDWSKNTLLGFFLSKNNAMLSLITHHLGYHYKGALKMKIWNFANNEDQALNWFMKLDRISDGLDLLEVMKVCSLQKREFIGNKLPERTNYDSLALPELKKYLCLAKISQSVFDQVETVTRYNLKQAADILTMIYIQLSVSLLGNILADLRSNGAISEYKREVGHVCYTHLKDVVISNFLKENGLMGNYLEQVQRILRECTDCSMQEALLCKICEQTYAGLSCASSHSDIRCSFTMVQIVNSKLKCPMCARYVAEEAVAFNEDLSCALCDSPLQTVFTTHPVKSFVFEKLCEEEKGF